MTLGLLVALENADKQTNTQTRFMFYKYRFCAINFCWLAVAFTARRCAYRTVVVCTYIRQLTERQNEKCKHHSTRLRHIEETIPDPVLVLNATCYMFVLTLKTTSAGIYNCHCQGAGCVTRRTALLVVDLLSSTRPCHCLLTHSSAGLAYLKDI